jgi:hypothetical protein
MGLKTWNKSGIYKIILQNVYVERHAGSVRGNILHLQFMGAVGFEIGFYWRIKGISKFMARG